MKRSHHLVRLLLVVAAVAATGGCQLFNEDAVIQGQSQGHSPLRPARQSPDSVAIEMMWVRFPADDLALGEEAWHDIDETQLSPDVRRELAANGFRAGVIRGSLPDAMARALDAYKPSKDDSTAPNSPGSNSKLDLVHDPVVHGRLKQLRRNERWEIQASDIYPAMPLLRTSGRELGGRTYENAQGLYALRIDPQGDRTVLLELTPELHYGQAKLRFSGGDEGVLRSLPLRDREVYDRMRMNVRLSSGEMLVLMSLPNSGSRLGDYFHTADSSQGRQQKMILLRLAQVPQSDTFAAE